MSASFLFNNDYTMEELSCNNTFEAVVKSLNNAGFSEIKYDHSASRVSARHSLRTAKVFLTPCKNDWLVILILEINGKMTIMKFRWDALTLDNQLSYLAVECEPYYDEWANGLHHAYVIDQIAHGPNSYSGFSYIS